MEIFWEGTPALLRGLASKVLLLGYAQTTSGERWASEEQ